MERARYALYRINFHLAKLILHFSKGTKFLIPLSNSEQRLAEILLQQPEKMINTEEALKCMEERAKKRRKVKPSSASVTSPLSSLFRHGEKKEGS